MTEENTMYGINQSFRAEDNSPLGIYRRAAAMETELRGLMDRAPVTPMTGDRATAYNQLLDEARQLAPRSVALREDLTPIDDENALAVDDAYRAVHVTLLPTIHNALPEADYAHL